MGRLFEYIAATVSTLSPTLFERMRTRTRARHLAHIQVEEVLIEISIDDQKFLRSAVNKRAEIVIKGIFVTGLVNPLNFILGRCSRSVATRLSSRADSCIPAIR